MMINEYLVAAWT